MKSKKTHFLLTLAWTFLVPFSVLGDDTPEAALRRKEDCEIAGLWKVSFSPNRAVRTYSIAKDGTVIFAETGGWKTILKTTNISVASKCPPHNKERCLPTLLPGIAQNESKMKYRWYLRFAEDPVGCFEVISFTEEGHLFVEHFNPTMTELPLPDQIGIGHRVASTEIDEVRESTKLNSNG